MRSIFNRFTVTVVHERICQLYLAWKTIFISLSALYYEQLDDERFNVLFNSVSVISGRRECENERLNALEHRLRLGAPVAQWVKRWPTDLAVPSSIPTRGKISSTVKGGCKQPFIINLSSSWYDWNTVEKVIHPSFTADKVSAFSGNRARQTHCAMGLISLQKIPCRKPSEEMITRMRVK